MAEIKIIPCTSGEMLKETAELADEIWHEYFGSLLAPDQIDYMVDLFQSEPAMVRQTSQEHYRYYQVWNGGRLAGFIGLKYEPDRLFLSKLYLKKDERGKGIASQMLEHVYEQARLYHYPAVYLTCNKYNAHSLDVYAAKGFQTIDAVVTDIGNGYVMDDFILEKRIGPEDREGN